MVIRAPTRAQLAAVANGDQELLRALESLFTTTSTTIPADTQTAQNDAATAMASVMALASVQAEADRAICEVATAAQSAISGFAMMMAAAADLAELVERAQIDARSAEVTAITGL